MPKTYDMWNEFKVWLERFDPEETIGVDHILDKIDELESEYE